MMRCLACEHRYAAAACPQCGWAPPVRDGVPLCAPELADGGGGFDAALFAQVDPALQRTELKKCLQQLRALPHGDLRQFTTSIAVQDVDAVRQRLGAAQVNLVGASYGTRAALEYMRQFPQAVRRVVIDGVAPPDMVLPAAASADAGRTTGGDAA